MDAIRNPYAPGAGSPPPKLTGRDEVRQSVRVATERVRLGRAARSVLLVGLRGVGKTVLLDQIREDAQQQGMHTLQMEAPEDRSLPALLAPELRLVLLRLSRVERARDLAQHAMRGLAGFIAAMKVKFKDIEVTLNVAPEPGLADNGDLEYDLQSLLEAVGLAAKQAESAVVMYIDELQYVHKAELGALITALHRVSRKRMPVTMVGAGLPQLPGRMGKAKSYAERLFIFSKIDALPEDAARQAIAQPAEEQNVDFDEAALARIIEVTHGYPYFLQEWASHIWEVADDSPITVADVEAASEAAVAALDDSFFRVRFDRLTPKEKQYLLAMAQLGPGPHRSGDVAMQLNRKVESVAPLRNGLVSKGMIWSPHHGDTAFTVPLFDEFMRRIMPDAWRH